MNTNDGLTLWEAKELRKKLTAIAIFAFLLAILGGVFLITYFEFYKRIVFLILGIIIIILSLPLFISIYVLEYKFNKEHHQSYNTVIFNDFKARATAIQYNSNVIGPLEFCDSINKLKILNGIFTKNILREIDYKDILGVDLLIDNQSQLKGGLGGAVLGGVVFGGVGAIAGSIIGKTTKNYVNSLTVKLTVASGNPCEMINLISFKTETNTEKYKSAFDDAQRIISKIQVILNNNNKPNTPSSNETINENIPIGNNSYSNTFSGTFADIKSDTNEQTNEKDIPSLLRDYKALLDDGIITPEEFESKKKELLNKK